MTFCTNAKFGPNFGPLFHQVTDHLKLPNRGSFTLTMAIKQTMQYHFNETNVALVQFGSYHRGLKKIEDIEAKGWSWLYSSGRSNTVVYLVEHLAMSTV